MFENFWWWILFYWSDTESFTGGLIFGPHFWSSYSTGYKVSPCILICRASVNPEISAWVSLFLSESAKRIYRKTALKLRCRTCWYFTVLSQNLFILFCTKISFRNTLLMNDRTSMWKHLHNKTFVFFYRRQNSVTSLSSDSPSVFNIALPPWIINIYSLKYDHS